MQIQCARPTVYHANLFPASPSSTHFASRCPAVRRQRYEEEDCSAEIELQKPEKSLPAITSFFRKAPAGPTGDGAGSRQTGTGRSPAKADSRVASLAEDSKSSPIPPARREANGKSRSSVHSAVTAEDKVDNDDVNDDDDDDDDVINGGSPATPAKSISSRAGGARRKREENAAEGDAFPLDLTPEEHEFVFGSVQEVEPPHEDKAEVEALSVPSPTFSGKQLQTRCVKDRARGAREGGSSIPESPSRSSSGKKRPAKHSPNVKQQASPAMARDKKQPRLTSFFQRS